jgi:serine/threonine protein kinase/tetratricopeptide (TPR) repeat protein
MPLSPGDKLGPYEILAFIGAGGMGEVWKACDTRLNRTVAVKKLKGDHSARFEQEAQAVAALNHPHICQIHDVGPDYLVLEFIEGSPLKGPLTAEQALPLAAQIAGALEAAHKRGILHRDLKPANVLVTENGAKLLDFGLAKFVSESETTETTRTIEGSVVGTAAYMSPEQAQGKCADARSDIFSFGALLYEVLSGRRAFEGDSMLQTLNAIVAAEPAPFESPLYPLVKRCMAKDALRRFQTAGELKAALEQVPLKAAKPAPSLAVLPFTNMSGDKEQEYFSDGLTEEIINFLAQIPGLKVTARTSAFAFKGKTEDIRRIAETLGVNTILEGSVRRSGPRIRVTTQLINAQDGYHLWSQRYDREVTDLFDLQDEIGQAIASALRVKLSGTPVPYRPSLPAYDALLKARYYFGTFRPDLLPHAKECFERAIALDPKFTLAHCEYGNYFWGMTLAGALPANQALPMIRSLAEKALELDPSLSDGHAMSGIVAACLEYDWKEAERRFCLATTRDPVSVNVRLYYSLYLLIIGRPAEAVQQVDLGLQEDPLNLTLQQNRAAFLAAAGRDEEATTGLREVLELNPTMVIAQLALAGLHATRGEFDQAMALSEKAYALAPLPSAIGWLAGLLKRAGDSRRAEELLRKLQPGDAFGAPRGLAAYHWVLRDFDAEADWIEKAIDQHDPYGVLYLRVWYGRELHSTPRWAALMRKLNLPES